MTEQVNKTINMLCSWHAQGKDSKEFIRHVERLPDYLWLASDGMKMQVLKHGITASVHEISIGLLFPAWINLIISV